MKLIQRLFHPIERLFLWSSGADLDVLDQVPQEKSKYYGIGGTIVFTALMASFAGGYAFYTAFQITHIAIFFGLFWGALIFNLDRYIVASFGVGDGKRTISRQELLEAAPRLLMAALLGFVIATPLELKLFQGEIEAQVQNNVAVARQRIESRNETGQDPQIMSWKSQLSSISTDLTDIQSEEGQMRAARDTAYAAQEHEWVYGCGTHPPGKGPHYNDLLDRYIDAKRAYDGLLVNNASLVAGLRSQQTNLNSLVAARTGKALQNTQNDLHEADKSRGLMARLEALGDLTQRSASIWWAKWLITLLFIFVEIAPVMFKMMTERGPYDDIVDQKKYEVLLAQQLKRSRLNENANGILKANRNNQEEFLQAEQLKNREMLQLIVEAQKVIAAEAIQAWKEDQLLKVKDNVGVYIRTGKGPGAV